MTDRQEALVALATCFNVGETIYCDATRAQVRRQVSAGNHIMCAGTNGDFSALTFDEKVRLCAEVVVDAVEMPVYLHDIPSRTQNHIEPETARILAGHGNILGIKDSGGARDTLVAYMAIGRDVDGFDV